MGIVQDGDKAPKSMKLTGGQAPRFLGVLDGGAQRPALEKTEQTIERLGTFSNLDAHFNQARSKGVSKADASSIPGSERDVGNYEFSVDPLLDEQPDKRPSETAACPITDSGANAENYEFPIDPLIDELPDSRPSEAATASIVDSGGDAENYEFPVDPLLNEPLE
jgi:hypothetical protein